MSIKSHIQSWLGITELNQSLKSHITYSERTLANIKGQLSTITPGLSRVIAKLDANYARDELDPAKRAESQRIADEVLKRLEGEAKARAPYNIGRDNDCEQDEEA